MVRAGDIFYPTHFPARMEDSLGVDHSGIPGHTAGPSYPSDQLLARPQLIAQMRAQSSQAPASPARYSISTTSSSSSRGDIVEEGRSRTRLSLTKESSVRDERSISPKGKRKAKGYPDLDENYTHL